MKKEFLLVICITVSLCNGFSQTIYNAGNALTLDSVTFNLGGTATKHTAIKGKYGTNLYNFSLDTFNLLNFMSKRADIEGSDSIRLASSKLVKLLSSGDIHLGTSNSLILDGNLTFKRLKKPLTSNALGLLSVDTCGRVFVSTEINASNYLKTGGNTFNNMGENLYFGSLDSTSINFFSFQNSGEGRKSNIQLGADGNIEIYSKGQVTFRPVQTNHPFLRLGYGGQPFMGIIGSSLRFWTHGIDTETPSYGQNISFFNMYGTGDAYNFRSESFKQEGQGTSNIFSVKGFAIEPKGNNAIINALNINTVINPYSADENCSVRNLYLDTWIYPNTNFFNNFRSIQSVNGHVALNTASGNTLIGTNEINGKKLQVYGDASISSQLTIGDTASNNSAILQLNTTTQGFLPPRLTTVNRNNISEPVEGLIVFNVDSSWLEIYTADGWYKLLSNTVSTGRGYQSRQSETNNTVDITETKSFVTRLGDGRNKVFTIKHNLNSEFIMVQFIDCGAEANCNLLLSVPDGARIELNGKNETMISFKEAPAFNRYKVMFLKIN